MLKDKLYNYFVRTNGRVWYEYERYVRENIEEHRLHRLKHLRLLLKLNWFYRVKKGNTPYLYWDVPLNPKQSDSSPNKEKTNVVSEYLSEKRCTAYAFAMGLKEYDVISFDAFDTLIFRKLGEPEHVFMLVGQKLGIYDYIRIRRRAEKEVREEKYVLYGHRECTLTEIYRKVSFYTGIDEREGMETEIAVEMACCVENPYIKQVYQILKNMGKKIFVTSNMYLESDILREILCNCGYDYFEDILVSCDYNFSKSSGHLFDILVEKAQSRSIVHIGDNIKTDIEGAKLVEIDAKLYASISSKGDRYRARGFSSLIGSAYYSLINRKLHSGVTPCLDYSLGWEFGYVFGGLTGLGYVNWIHEKAKEANSDKVLFLARDGALLKAIYDTFFQDIPSDYMLWSRMAGVRDISVGGLDQVLLRCIEENVDSGLSVEEVIKMLGWENCSVLFEEVMPIKGMPICQENYKTIQHIISDNWNEIVRKQKKICDVTEHYICARVKNCKRITLVDLGWTGKNDYTIKRILNKLYPSIKVDIYLMGSLVKTQEAFGIKNRNIECYMFSADFNREIHDTFVKNWKLLDCMEKIFSSATCSFMGFSEQGRYEFAEPEIENYLLYREIASGVIDFCQEYAEDYSLIDPAFLNISGYDAYVSIRNILKNNVLYEDLFSGKVFSKGMNPINKVRIES